MRTREQMVSRRIFVTGGAAVAAWTVWQMSHGLRMPTVEAKSGAGTPTAKQVKIVQFSDQGQRGTTITEPMVVKSDAEWKQSLPKQSYEVLRHADTEYPGTGKLLNEHNKGIFRCLACDNALFSSETKFESHTGWPSFWQPIAPENVNTTLDATLGMDRTEVKCRLCDGHLGHVFDDGPKPTGLRYCMNSAAMKFVKFA